MELIQCSRVDNQFLICRGAVLSDAAEGYPRCVERNPVAIDYEALQAHLKGIASPRDDELYGRTFGNPAPWQINIRSSLRIVNSLKFGGVHRFARGHFKDCASRDAHDDRIGISMGN